jgi:exosome complex RNA-binding protein Rrp42 (RNase PH superfamily)
MYTIKIYESGNLVASVSSVSAYAALREATVYALNYEQDGRIDIKIKNPKKVKNND